MDDRVLWAIRDDRTLSQRAKLAYIMLWSRGKDARPSLKKLAADMGSKSETTARSAVAELQEAGLVKVLPRVNKLGGADTNRYCIVPPELPHPPSDFYPTPVSESGPEVPKAEASKRQGDKSQVTRRARPAPERTDPERITVVRAAVARRGWDNRELDDEDALNVYVRFFITERVTDDPVGDEVSYLYSGKSKRGGIFAWFDSVDGVLENTPERDVWDLAG